MLKWLSIHYLMWNLRRQGIENIEYVIRSDGNTCHRRDKKKEKEVTETLEKIK